MCHYPSHDLDHFRIVLVRACCELRVLVESTTIAPGTQFGVLRPYKRVLKGIREHEQRVRHDIGRRRWTRIVVLLVLWDMRFDEAQDRRAKTGVGIAAPLASGFRQVGRQGSERRYIFRAHSSCNQYRACRDPSKRSHRSSPSLQQ